VKSLRALRGAALVVVLSAGGVQAFGLVATVASAPTAFLAAVLVATSFAFAGDADASLASDTDRVVAGSMSEAEEQALFGQFANVSVQIADAYDQWVRTGSEDKRREALASGSAILPLLERIRAHHQGRIDRALQKIIDEDGNPEVLYKERWWQLDRGFTLAAAGQLSWLHYRMAMLSPGDKEKRRGWLEKAVREFGEFTAADDPKMSLESILGRGMAQAELGNREAAESDLQLVMQQGKGTELYWPARMALGQIRASAGDAAAVSETQKLLAEAQSAGVPAGQVQQIRMLRFNALLNLVAAGSASEAVRSEAAQLAAQLSSQGPAVSQRVTQMTLAKLKDPRPILGATVSSEWIAAENLAAAEKFDEAIKAYERIARSTDPSAREHATDVHHRLGVSYFRLGRYADAERELRAYLAARPTGALSTEAAYLQFRAAEGVFRKTPTPETRSSFLAVAENFTKNYPDHESRYEGLFRYGELLQSEGRYMEAADAYAKVEGPPAFRMRAASAELQCIADTLATTEDLDVARTKELRARAEGAWQRFDKAAGTSASSDLRARTTVARAIAAGSGPEPDAKQALALLEDFEKRFPDVKDLALATTALRLASATSLDLVDKAEPQATALAAMPGLEANYFDLVEKLSRALLRRSADAAPTDPAASQKWAAMATALLDKMRAAGKPIPGEVRLNLAQSYVEQNRLNDAAQLYAQLLAATPESRSLLRASALVADRRGEAAEAAGFWSRLALLQEVATPAWYEARLAAAAALQAAGQNDKSCAGVKEVDAFRPDLRDAETKKKFADLLARVCAGQAS
jgi:TolA-binding protein